MKKAATAVCATKTLSEGQAAEAMWVYYKQHKAELMTDIKEYRDYILAELVKGVSAEKVFLQFVRAPEPAMPARRVR